MPITNRPIQSAYGIGKAGFSVDDELLGSALCSTGGVKDRESLPVKRVKEHQRSTSTHRPHTAHQARISDRIYLWAPGMTETIDTRLERFHSIYKVSHGFSFGKAPPSRQPLAWPSSRRAATHAGVVRDVENLIMSCSSTIHRSTQVGVLLPVRVCVCTK